jgi:hypothetical protein
MISHVGKIATGGDVIQLLYLGVSTQVIASLDSPGHKRTKLSFRSLGAVEASRVNLSERRLGRARHGGLFGSDLRSCKCAPEIVSTKKVRRNNCRRMCSV